MKIGEHSYYGSEASEAVLVHDYGLDLPAREIWLTPNDDYAVGVGDTLPSDPGVDYTMATRFLKNLHILMNADRKPILVHMKTFGGDWDQGIAIYDAIKTCPCPVTIINYTAARSMSSLIFSAASRRVMMPHSKFMFHMGGMAFDGTSKQFATEAEQAKEMDVQMLDIYVEVMGKSKQWAKKSDSERRKWLREQMDRKEEVYLSPRDAIKHGFADEVFAGDWDSLIKPDPICSHCHK